MPNSFSVEKEFNCPQCGYALALYVKHTKLIQCESCKSNIFLEDDATRLSGDSSVLAPEISILELNAPFFFEQKSYLPLGKIRYSYGRGFWEEWWVKDTQNNEYWLSVDEGDLVFQQKVEVTYPDDLFARLRIGLVTSDDWVVTELGEAKCEGFAGSLPKNIVVGSTYAYAHLSGKDAKLRTLELVEDKLEAYEGKWISPFDIGKLL
jgi:DNA-directed RNA polymerase subunit RPC12/RpoP